MQSTTFVRFGFINIQNAALILVMCTGNCQIILQGLKSCFNTLQSLHGHYKVELTYREIPVVITGNGFAVKVNREATCCILS
jgi:hypothetical protein